MRRVKRNGLRRKLLTAAVAACFAGELVYANPVGPTVLNGQAHFSTQGNTLSVTNTPGAIINWQQFSINARETTRFIQLSSSSSVLNRVTGHDPSTILGALQSNGRVFLINPNGILFGAGSRIDVAGLVASTLDLSNQDFLAGRMRFSAGASGTGAVVNQGRINAAPGGQVYLIGSSIDNQGTITAPNGDIILAAGRSVRVTDSSSGTLQVEVTAPTDQPLNLSQLATNPAGAYAGLVRNSGGVRADAAVLESGGRIVLKATRGVITTESSVLSANGATGGNITVTTPQGVVAVEGTVEAIGKQGGGGRIVIVGEHTGLFDDAHIDASGATSGGTILVGGDYQGRHVDGDLTFSNSLRTYIAPTAVLRADATHSGDGGTVVVWSEEVTRYFGTISARGGAVGGDGGFVETSSKDDLQAFGSVDASASVGRPGSWLLDPRNVTIAAATAGGAFDGGSPNTFTPSADSATVNVASINTSLNGGTSVTITTGNTGTQAGDITVASAINRSSGNTDATLKLSAAGNITINAGTGITRTGTGTGKLNVALDAGVGPGATSSNIAVNAPITLTTNNGSLTATGSVAGSTFQTAGSGTISLGTGALSITSGSIALGTATTAGSLLATATSGDITQSAGTAAIGGTATLTANSGAINQTGGNITATTLTVNALNNSTLNQATNNTTTLIANISGANQNLIYRDTNALVLGASSVTGNLTVTTAGAITETGALTVGGTSSFSAGANAITLTSANQLTGAVSLANSGANNVSLTNNRATVLGTSTIGRNLTVSASGPISQTGIATVAGTSSFSAGANAISLTQANQLTGAVSLSNSGANDVSLTNNRATVLAASSVGGNLAVNAAGAITQTGVATVAGDSSFSAGANAITLTQANQLAGAVTLSNSGANNVSLTNNRATVLAASSVGGNLTVSATGAITETGAATVAGTSSFSAGANAITLTQPNQLTGAVSLTNSGANDVSLTNNRATVLGTSTIGRNLTVGANGALSQTGVVTVAGASSFSAGANAITLNNAGNNFVGAVSFSNSGANDVSLRDANALILGTSSTGGNLTVVNSGALTQSGALGVAGTASFNAGAGVITLTNAGNDFAGAVSLANSGANAIQITDANALTLGAVSTANNLTVNAAGITQTASAIAVTGTSSFNAGAGAITLNNATNNFVGAVSLTNTGANDVAIADANALVLGASSVGSGALTVTAAGAITQTGALIQAAGAGAASIATGSAAITLNNAGNDFTGAVSLTNTGANNVSLRDANTITLGSSSIGNNLAVTAGGTISQTGALTVTGTSTFTLTAPSSDVLLNSAANNFTGALTFGSPANIRDVGLRNTNAGATVPALAALTNLRNLTLQFDNAAVSLPATTLHAGGNLAVTAGGAITQAGAVVVPGTATLTAGANAITLNNAGNDFQGAVSFTNFGANNVTLRDTNSLILAAGSTGGNLAATTNGAITQTGALIVTGTSNFTAGANAITLANAGNDFTGAVSLSNAGANNAIVNDTNALTLGTSTVGGSLTAFAGGTITLSGNLNAGGAGNSIVLAAAEDFVNSVGAGALNPGPGRWLVYSTSPGGSIENGLTGAAGSAMPRLYNRTFAANSPATITEPGNHLLYGFQPALTVTPNNHSKVYGTDDPTQTFLAAGFITDDGVTDTAITAGLVGSFGRVPGESVAAGPYLINRGSFASNAGYSISFIAGNTLTITPANLTGSIANQNKIYGVDDPSLAGITVNLGGAVNRTVTNWNGAVTAIDDTGNVGTTLASLTRTAGETVSGSPYSITAAIFNPLTGSAAGNYNAPTFTGVPTLTISKANLTGLIANQSKVYGADDPSLAGIAVNLGGAVNRTVTNWNGAVTAIDDTGNVGTTLASLTRTAGETVSGSPYSITAAIFNPLTGSAAGNYNAPTFTGVPTLTISKANLTGLIANQSKVYGADDPSLAGIAVNLGGAVNRTVANWNGAVTAIDDTGNVGTTLASLTRTAGETVSGSPYSIAAAIFNPLTGSAAGNYNAATLIGSPTLTISRANLTSVIANQSKVYGADDPSLAGIAVNLGGVVNNPTIATWNGNVAVNDTADVATTLASLTRTAGETVSGSPYNITAAAFNPLTGSAAGNYNAPIFTGVPTLTISKANLTGVIANQSKVYGADDPSLAGIAVNLGGAVNRTVTNWNGAVTAIDDTGNVATTLVSLTRSAGESVSGSPYAITAATFNPLTGSAAGNYTAPVFTGASTLAITPAALTATIANQAKVYGADDPALSGIGVVLGGAVNTTVADWNGNNTVINDTLAPNLSGNVASLTRTPGEIVAGSPYNVTAAVFALAGSDAGNYSAPLFTGTPTLTITPVALAGTIANQTKVYGADDPALAGIAVNLGGVVNNPAIATWNGNVAVNDTGNVATSLVNLTRTAGETVSGSPYAVTAATFNPLTGSAAGNYNAPTFTGVPTLTIGQAALSAQLINPNQAKIYGADDPPLTSVGVTLGGLVNRTVATWNGSVGVDDSALTSSVMSLSRAVGENVGSYSVTGGVFSAASANYGAPTFDGSNSPLLAITAAPALTALLESNPSKVYGASDPAPVALGITLSGVVNNPAIATWNGNIAVNDTGNVATTVASLAREAGENVGSYNITTGTLGPLTGVAAANYAGANFVPGGVQLNITPAALFVTADDKSRAQDAPNPPFTATYSGFKFSETPAVLGGVLTFTTAATIASPAGLYPITPSGHTASNYVITYVNGTLTVGTPIPTSLPPAVAQAINSTVLDLTAVTQGTSESAAIAGGASSFLNLLPPTASGPEDSDKPAAAGDAATVEQFEAEPSRDEVGRGCFGARPLAFMRCRTR